MIWLSLVLLPIFENNIIVAEAEQEIFPTPFLIIFGFVFFFAFSPHPFSLAPLNIQSHRRREEDRKRETKTFEWRVGEKKQIRRKHWKKPNNIMKLFNPLFHRAESALWIWIWKHRKKKLIITIVYHHYWNRAERMLAGVNLLRKWILNSLNMESECAVEDKETRERVRDRWES